MNHNDDELHRAVGLFRYGLIADLAHLPPGTPGIGERLREKAKHSYTIPGTRRTRVAAETIRDWLALYRGGGFEALYPKARVDRGRPRRLPADIAELLVGLKTEQPSLSVNALIGAARERGVECPLAPSTVHRLLSREGLLDKRPGEPVAIDRRRFAFRYAGELWMSDVMHGPKVSDGRRRRKTFLIAFIDDATRVLPFAAFDFSESTTAFLPVLKSALTRRGLPLRLYVDNGANYRSHQLALVCAKLGIALIHARPWQPAGKGEIERFFRTLRAAWLERLDADATSSLEALNRGLDGRTPLEQWALAGGNVRYPGPDLDLDDLFLFEAKRRVMKDRTVSLHGRLYEEDFSRGSEQSSIAAVLTSAPFPSRTPPPRHCRSLQRRLQPSARATSSDGSSSPPLRIRKL